MPLRDFEKVTAGFNQSINLTGIKRVLKGGSVLAGRLFHPYTNLRSEINGIAKIRYSDFVDVIQTHPSLILISPVFIPYSGFMSVTSFFDALKVTTFLASMVISSPV